MRLLHTMLRVGDMDKSIAFYTEVLGFQKKNDIPMGAARWITVVSPDGPGDLELVLEPNSHPAANAYQTALRNDGIPVTAFESADLQEDVRRLKEKGVAFTVDPTPAGMVAIAIFSDTCGNLIQLYQMNG